MNITKAWDKARKENLQRDRADEVVKGTMHFFLGLTTLVLLAHCGGSSGQSGAQAAQAVNWKVTAGSMNVLEGQRLWEICGGTVLCNNVSDIPFIEPFVTGFTGAASPSQASCYQIYSGLSSLETTTAQCREMHILTNPTLSVSSLHQ